MEDELRKLKTPAELADAITGRHNPRNTGAGYGRGYRGYPDESFRELSQIPSPVTLPMTQAGDAGAFTSTSAQRVAAAGTPTTDRLVVSVAAAASGSPDSSPNSDRAERSARLLVEWFELEADRAYEAVLQLGEPLRSAVQDDAEEFELARYLASHDAEHALERLQEEFSQRNFARGRAVLAQLLQQAGWPVPSVRRLDRGAAWVMRALAEIEDSRMRWAAGDIDYRPSLPEARLFGRLSLPNEASDERDPPWDRAENCLGDDAGA